MTHQHNNTCICSNEDVLICDRKNLSRYVAIMIFIGVMVFVAGYFMGKKNTIFSLSGTMNRHSDIVLTQNNEQKESNISLVALKDENLCYATLMGFESFHTAQQLVTTLKKEGINTTLLEQINHSSHNADKDEHWYQVVTDNYSSLLELKQFVAQVQKIVDINEKDIEIVKVDKHGDARKNSEEQII